MYNNRSIIGYLVKRYLRWDKTQPFISVTAILAFVGVSIGVMVLLVTMAIMNGTVKEFEDKLFAMNYPITIYPKYSLNTLTQGNIDFISSKMPHLKFSPFIKTQAIIKNGNSLSGGMVYGVDFEKEAKINKIIAKSVEGFDKVNGFKLITGKGISDELNMEKNSKVMMIFTNTEPVGFSNAPKMKRFKYINYFESGLIAYDKAFMYTDIKALAKIQKLPQNIYDGVHVYSKDPHKDIKALEQILPYNLGAIGWWEQNGNFFSALEMEKKALFLILMLIILVASLNIISSLLMTVMNRRKEIALLLSLGASKAEIKKTFFYLGVIIGGSGVVFGVLLGLGSIFILQNYDIITIPADVYGTSKLPTNLSMMDLGLTVFGAFVVIILSSFYPALKASKIDVLNVLRYE
jgi:putative ABC transport system permease protein